MKNMIRILGVVVLVGLFYNPVVVFGQFFFMENEKVGKPVEDFTLKVVNGGEVSLESFRDGKQAIVFFWATWCPHCREALSELDENKETIEEQGIKVALVDVGEKESVVSNYLDKNKIQMNVFLDEESVVSERYEVIGVPTFYFVDEGGIVLDVQHSFPEDLEKVFSET